MAETKNNNAAPAKAVTAVKKEDKKLNFLQRIAKWFREMKSELKKVVWPTKKQLWNNTLVSIVSILVSAVCVWGFDELAQLVVKAIFTIAG